MIIHAELQKRARWSLWGLWCMWRLSGRGAVLLGSRAACSTVPLIIEVNITFQHVCSWVTMFNKKYIHVHEYFKADVLFVKQLCKVTFIPLAGPVCLCLISTMHLDVVINGTSWTSHNEETKERSSRYMLHGPNVKWPDITFVMQIKIIWFSLITQLHFSPDWEIIVCR